MNFLLKVAEDFNNYNTNGLTYDVFVNSNHDPLNFQLIIREVNSDSTFSLQMLSYNMYNHLVFALSDENESALVYNSLHIHPNYEGKGVGTDLVKLALKCADCLDQPILIARDSYSFIVNQNLKDFFISQGFVDFPNTIDEGLIYYPK